MQVNRDRVGPLLGPSLERPPRSAPQQVPRGKAAAICLSVLFVARMFYVLPSGTIQPADAVFALLFVWAVWREPSILLDRRLAAFLLIVAWIAGVNFTWFVILGDATFILSGVYYAFNFTVFLVFLLALKNNKQLLLRSLTMAILVASLVQAIVVILTSGGARALGTFNSPNQLGYWCLLCAGCYVLIRDDVRWSVVDYVTLVALTVSCFRSLSQAASLALVALWALVLFRQAGRAGWGRTGLFIVALIAVVSVFSEQVSRYVQASEMYASIESRLANTVSRSSEWQYRGYDRIGENLELVVMGAGEGVFSRFAEDRGLELHSSFGTLLFAYGLVGLGLFLVLLWQVLSRATWMGRGVLGVALLYGATHQGLRFTWFWILLALVAGLGNEEASDKRVRSNVRVAINERVPSGGQA